MTQPFVEIETATGIDLDDMLSDVSDVEVLATAAGINDAMNNMAALVNTKYSIITPGAIAGDAVTDPNRFTWRTGRLGGSYNKKPRFSFNRLPGSSRAKKAARISNTTKVSGGQTGAVNAGSGTQEGIHKIEFKRGEVTGFKGSEVPYAAAVEKNRPSISLAAKDTEPLIGKMIVKRSNEMLRKLGWK